MTPYDISPLSDLLCDSLWVHPCCRKWHYFLLFYGRGELGCIEVPHLLCPLPCGGHLGCFHVSAVVNSAAGSMGRHVFFELQFVQIHAQEWGCCGNPTFSLLRNLDTVATPTYTPTKSVGGFPLFHTLSSICCL